MEHGLVVISLPLWERYRDRLPPWVVPSELFDVPDETTNGSERGIAMDERDLKFIACVLVWPWIIGIAVIMGIVAAAQYVATH